MQKIARIVVAVAAAVMLAMVGLMVRDRLWRHGPGIIVIEEHYE